MNVSTALRTLPRLALGVSVVGLTVGLLAWGLPVSSATAMREAQERVEAAEARLWELRERYLGWSRPSWVPSATLVSVWFSDED